MLTGHERLAFGDFVNDTVHMYVAREIQIETAPSNLRPGLYFLRDDIKDRIRIVNLRHVCVPCPITIEVSLDAPAAAYVRGTVNGILLLWSCGLRLRRFLILRLILRINSQRAAEKRERKSGGSRALHEF